MKRPAHRTKARHKNQSRFQPPAIQTRVWKKETKPARTSPVTDTWEPVVTPVPFGWLQYRWHLLLLLLLPWIIFMVNPNWPFQGLDHMDPWYYFGSFRHFPQYQRLIPNYAGERLTWILPGYLLAHMLPLAYASLALHVLCFYVSVLCVYYIVGKYSNSRTALLTSSLLGCHSLFLSANGWDYVDGGSLAYECLTLAFLAASDRARHPLFFVASAGAAWGGLIYTYPLWAGLTPGFIVFYFVITYDGGRFDWRRIICQCLSFGVPYALGFTFLTGVLSLVHLWSGGHGFFYSNSIATMISFSKLDKNPFSANNFRWVPFASWLVFPVFAFLVCVGAWIQHWRGKLSLSRAAQAITAAYVCFFGFMVVMTVRPNHALEWDFVANILIPGTFLVLGMTVLRVPDSTRVSAPLFGAVLVVACAICVFPLSRPRSYQLLLIHGLLFPASLAVIGAAVRLALATRPWAWVFVVGCTSCSSFPLAPEYPALAWQFHYKGLSAQERIASAIDVIRKRVPEDRYPAFWFNNYDDPLTAEYRGIMCSFLAHGLSMYHYPKLDAKRVYPTGAYLILLTTGSDPFAAANRTMSQAGMPLALVSRDMIAEDGVSYQITCVKVLPKPIESGNVRN
jgi:hypothetical protein